MLVNLHVKNLAIIDEVEVDFSENMNVLTGETGAGKSIIIGSVNLALGGKFTGDMIRTGADQALVELLFTVDRPEQREALEALGVTVDGEDVLISRKLMQKRSVCRVNGETVTQSLIKKIAGILIDIHGQHDNQTLLGYYGNKSDKELKFMMNYLHIKRVSQIPKAMLRAAYASIADTVIFQMQDILELDDTARMNEPSTVGTNWRWRMQPGAFDGKKIKMLRKMCKLYAR